MDPVPKDSQSWQKHFYHQETARQEEAKEHPSHLSIAERFLSVYWLTNSNAFTYSSTNVCWKPTVFVGFYFYFV